jgi:tRNA (pseudouridine54-N1)-methyltransferase
MFGTGVCLSRGFVLFSRLGRTDGEFGSLHDAGRLDIVYECIVASLFLSHAIRKDVVFHAVLNGPPSPPVHLRVEGASVHDVRTDQRTWEQILKKVLSARSHPGILTRRLGFEALLKDMASKASVYVLEEGGEDVATFDLGDNAVFVLGDHVGLPKKAEGFALRYGQKMSLGRQPYLAASCITVLNYLLDRRGKS